MPDEYTTVRQPVPRLSDDKKSVLWAQVGADIKELEECCFGYQERIVELEQQVEYLYKVCAQCIAEHQGRGQ